MGCTEWHVIALVKPVQYVMLLPLSNAILYGVYSVTRYCPHVTLCGCTGWHVIALVKYPSELSV